MTTPRAPATPIFFLHMPKAAGSTLYRVIKRVYGADAIRWVHGSEQAIADFLAEPEADRHAIDVLAGHLRYELRHALRRPATLVTMLRDPVERTLSLYHYIRRDPNHRLHDRVTAMTLDEFVGARWAPEADNDHVRRLNDAPDATVPVGQVTDAMLETAKERLARDDVLFGIAERFHDSLAHFRRTLGWPEIPYENANVTPNRPGADTLNDRILDRVREINRFDLELQRFAADLLDRRLGAG